MIEADVAEAAEEELEPSAVEAAAVDVVAEEVEPAGVVTDRVFLDIKIQVACLGFGVTFTP